MLQVESIVQSFVDFFRKLFITVYHIFFKPSRFIRNLGNSEQTYTQPYAFLYIAIYVSFLFHKVSGDSFFDSFVIARYSQVAREFNQSTLEVLIIGILPVTIGVSLLLYLLCRLLLIRGKWRDIIYRYLLYFFAGIQFLQIILFSIGLIFFAEPQGKDYGMLDRVSLAAAITFVSIAVWIITAITCLIAIKSIARILFINNKTLACKMIALTLVTFLLVMNVDSVFNTSDGLMAVTTQQEKKDEGNIYVYSAEGRSDKLIGYFSTNKKNEYRLSISAYLRNTTQQSFLFNPQDSMELFSRDSQLHVKLGINSWDNDLLQKNFLLEPGKIKPVILQTLLQDSIPGNWYEACSLDLNAIILQEEINNFTSYYTSNWKGILRVKKLPPGSMKN